MMLCKNFLVVLFIITVPCLNGMDTKNCKQWWHETKSAEINKVIKRLSSEIDLDMQFYQTPLHLAAINSDTDAVRLLIGHIPINVYDLAGATPLHKAACTLHVAIIRALFAAHVDVNAHDYLGATSLHEAARRRGNNEEENQRLKATLKVLIVEGRAKVNAQDMLDRTSLHYAVERNNKVAVEVLLEHGADLNIVDKGGKTPLHYAIKKMNMAIIEILLTYNSDLTIKDRSDKTPLDYCKDSNKGIILTILLKAKDARQKAATKQKVQKMAMMQADELTQEVITQMTSDLAHENAVKKAAEAASKKMVEQKISETIRIVMASSSAPTTTSSSFSSIASSHTGLTPFIQAIIGLVDTILEKYQPSVVDSKEERPRSREVMHEHISKVLRESADPFNVDGLIYLLWNQNVALIFNQSKDVFQDLSEQLNAMIAQHRGSTTIQSQAASNDTAFKQPTFLLSKLDENHFKASNGGIVIKPATDDDDFMIVETQAH